ncbi:hypothetical protein TNCV_4627241 [Trichonephila clavipes]|nr:hypothetical protein TNCV_4627241 [Trichonephila clavipes]
MNEKLKINNPSEGGGMNERPANEHRTSWATKRPRNKLTSKRHVWRKNQEGINPQKGQWRSGGGDSQNWPCFDLQ